MTCPSWCVHHTDPRHTWHRGGAHDDRGVLIGHVHRHGDDPAPLVVTAYGRTPSTDVLSAATRGGAR